MVAGNDVVRADGPALEVYGDPGPRLELVSNTAATDGTATFTRLESNVGVFSIQSGTDASTNGPITFGGFANERMRIGSDGKVGVGTTEPLSELDIYNPAGTELIVSRNAGSLSYPTIRLWNYDDNNYNNHAAGTPVGHINFSGNERLDGDTHTENTREFNYANTLYDWARISAVYVGSTSTSTSQGHVRGDLLFHTNNGDGATSNLQERMRIKHDGNVGIGLTNPSKTLDIGFVDYGSPGIRFTHTDPNGIDRRSSGYANYFTGLEAVIERYADKNVRYSGSNVPEVTHRINLGYSDSYNNSTGFYPQFHEMHFEVMNKVGEGDSTATLDRIMTLRGDGNVGIGTTDPKAPLHVNQNKAIINGQMSLQTLNVYKNAGGNSGSQTKRYYRVYVPNSYANCQIILQGFARNYTGSGDIQAWRRQYTVQRNSGAVVGISHDSGENINATGFTFATSTVGSATSVIEVHFDVTFPPKPEAATYISFTAQLMGDTGYFAENTSS